MGGTTSGYLRILYLNSIIWSWICRFWAGKVTFVCMQQQPLVWTGLNGELFGNTAELLSDKCMDLKGRLRININNFGQALHDYPLLYRAKKIFLFSDYATLLSRKKITSASGSTHATEDPSTAMGFAHASIKKSVMPADVIWEACSFSVGLDIFLSL